ncbi:MAG: heterodisulfide reductase subunit F [Chloroflexi bacterium]|jgi:sulfhydrogenase subunit gamma (sulfur reductase)|nr:heterodisulfide reductase subunit F [Chloroflexota bacterium]
MSDTHVCTCNPSVQNPYVPMSMIVQRVTDEVDDRTIKSFDLAFAREEDARCFQYTPGQFCELSVFGEGEAPFGIASSPTEQGFLRFTIKKAGVVTSRLHNCKPGDVIGLRGPLGNSFPLDLMCGKDVVVIGGGFAFTTLRSLIIYLLESGERDQYGKITVIYGARDPGLLMYKEDLAAWEQRDDIEVCQTIDREVPGWTRRVGFVPNVTEEVAPNAANAVAVICGPPIMIRFTLPVMTRLGFGKEQIYTSLENRMKCGIGKCGRCNVGHKYVCVDGPVFSMAELDQLPPEY